jgi:hypothetical protein
MLCPLILSTDVSMQNWNVFYQEKSWMKGTQTGQLRQKAEGQYLLHVFRLRVLGRTKIKFFFLWLAKKWIKNISSIQVLQKKRESSSVF